MPLVERFRCSRTGVTFPSDYIEQWGIKYGHGLGPVPVSEALVNHYHSPVCEGRNDACTMHPVGFAGGQLDFIRIDESEALKTDAILAKDDPDMVKRSAIMRDKQFLKSNKLQSMFPEEHAKVLAKVKVN